MAQWVSFETIDVCKIRINKSFCRMFLLLLLLFLFLFFVLFCFFVCLLLFFYFATLLSEQHDKHISCLKQNISQGIDNLFSVL